MTLERQEYYDPGIFKKTNGDFLIIEEMVRDNKIIVTEYNKELFYIIKLAG